VPEWLEIVKRDWNHPAIVGWCPFNETQTDTPADLLTYVYRMTKALDATRPVIETSGWVHIPGSCDMPDWHDYDQNPDTFRARYEKLLRGEDIDSILPPELPFGPPAGTDLCLVSEFGGTWWSPAQAEKMKGEKAHEESWGYGIAPGSAEEFLARYRGLVDALLDNERICAFCYTQLTDVEQEQNGIYFYDRTSKFDMNRIKAIFSKRPASSKE
jgi:hypothetical protein